MKNTVTKFSNEDAERLDEIFKSIQEQIGEFRDICYASMSRRDFEQFKYNCLGHLEPAVSNDHDWVSAYDGSLSNLEKVVERAKEDSEEEEEEDDEEMDEN